MLVRCVTHIMLMFNIKGQIIKCLIKKSFYWHLEGFCLKRILGEGYRAGFGSMCDLC